MAPIEARLPLTDLDDAAFNAARRLRAVASFQVQERAVVMNEAKALERALEADRQRRAAEQLLGEGDQEGFGPFHNRLRIMLALDRHELVAAGVIEAHDMAAWVDFGRSPLRFFIRADGDRAAKLWLLIQTREGSHAKSAR